MIRTLCCLLAFLFLRLPAQDTAAPATLFPVAFRLSLEAGLSRRTFDAATGVSAGRKKYLDALAFGKNLSLDMALLKKNTYGFGLRTSVFLNTSRTNEATVYSSTLDSVLGPGPGSDDNTLFFLGPAFYERIPLETDRFLLTASLAPGYLWYHDANYWVNAAHDYRGTAFGLSGSVSLDYRFAPSWAAGLTVSWVLATIKNMTDNGTSNDNLTNEDFNRFDFNLGLRFLR